MNQEFDPGNVGEEIGRESMQSVIANSETYCAHEERRINLNNEAEILALRAEFSRLLKDEQHLEERLRNAPLPGDRRNRKYRAVYYWTLTGVLALAGFIFSLLSFDPFRLGWKSYLYCLGIAAVTPFLIEKIIDLWNVGKVVKWIATIACIAAILSLGLLAVIRGDLFAAEFKEAQAPVVVEDDPPQTAPENTFYEKTLPLLRMVMVLLALAMELGAGLALRDAWKTASHSSGNWTELEKELRDVRGRMAELIYEITRLRNESAMFAARFWRNFYRAVLTHTVRSAMTKIVLLLCVMLPFIPAHAATPEGLTIVIPVDLTQSVAGRRPDEKSNFQKNIDAVTRALTLLPSGCHVVVLGVTGESFAQPQVLLSARVAAEPGYFNERLQAARRELVRQWKGRSMKLRPYSSSTDIMGLLFLAGHIFNESPHTRKVLIIFSDMRHHTRDLDLESGDSVPSFPRRLKVQAVSLKDVEVYALGVDGAGKTVAYWQSLKAFWSAYFTAAGAVLEDYSPLRDVPNFLRKQE